MVFFRASKIAVTGRLFKMAIERASLSIATVSVRKACNRVGELMRAICGHSSASKNPATASAAMTSMRIYPARDSPAGDRRTLAPFASAGAIGEDFVRPVILAGRTIDVSIIPGIARNRPALEVGTVPGDLVRRMNSQRVQPFIRRRVMASIQKIEIERILEALDLNMGRFHLGIGQLTKDTGRDEANEEPDDRQDDQHFHQGETGGCLGQGAALALARFYTQKFALLGKKPRKFSFQEDIS